MGIYKHSGDRYGLEINKQSGVIYTSGDIYKHSGAYIELRLINKVVIDIELRLMYKWWLIYKVMIDIDLR